MLLGLVGDKVSLGKNLSKITTITPIDLISVEASDVFAVMRP